MPNFFYIMYIESNKNPKIKNLVKLLEKSKERKNQRKFVVEGKKENLFALKNGFVPLEFYVQSHIFQNSITLPSSVIKYEVSQSVYDKIAYRKMSEGILGVYEYKTHELNQVKLPDNPFILIIESLEKPGNLGAICRSADAFGVDMVVVCEEKADIYNPNVLRSSVGSFFNIPIISTKNTNIYDFLIKKEIPIYATYMSQSSIIIQNVDFRQSASVIFGTEHSGISEYWKDKIEQNILIPMKGQIDSLNVSNAVAIVCYEMQRQKNM
ncbi:RNA methyltransferase, TrmH family [Apibacter mensalis]|uniref:RNA methyltransferase, TrmH family n=2 Tax=Apibacter mensalis TaxID=1586267 RepID=A0A0X3AM89_9FLAO|nr:RNA methyltransferase, TrmH family [Apibacter mensalis]